MNLPYMGCENEVRTKHISRVAQGAIEHHWYPTAVRIKSVVLPVSLAGSVTGADRRGADHEKYPGAEYRDLVI